MTELIESLVSQLSQDGSWQGHLTEDERELALQWVRDYLKVTTQARFVEARGRLRTLNAHMGERGDTIGRETVLQTWLG